MTQHEQLLTYCKSLRLPSLGAALPDTLAQAEKESWSTETCLLHLLEREVEGRRRRRIERFLKQSQLPPGKTLAQFDQSRLPLRIRRQMPQLLTGDFVDRCQNILFFGLPGTGKTHCAAGLGHALIETSRSVLFIPTYMLVSRLLRAKRDYELERELRRLGRFEVVILDDIGYVQQSREEMEVLFTFLAERYERRSSCSASCCNNPPINSRRRGVTCDAISSKLASGCASRHTRNSSYMTSASRKNAAFSSSLYIFPLLDFTRLIQP